MQSLISAGQSNFVRRTSLTRHAIYDPTLPDELIERLWQDPESLIKSGEMLRRTGQRRTVRLTWASERYVLKQYRPTWWHFVRQLPTRSRARSTFYATLRLMGAGIATPPPVACIENRWGGLRRDSFLMYRYVEGTLLRTYLNQPGKRRRPHANNLSKQLRDLWRQLEQLQASLADAHSGNFIVSPAGNVWVIDLDKTRFEYWTAVAARHRWRKWKQVLRETAAYEHATR